MPVSKQAYAAIREAAGREYIDIHSMAPTAFGANNKARITNAEIQAWGECNPVKRIALINLVEVEQVEITIL